MASRQRRLGETANIWRTVVVYDNRGNEIRISDEDGPHVVRASFIPQRSTRAEVPGQAIINIVRMVCAPELEGVELWSKVEYQGKFWDVVSPPALHVGTRKTRHWSIDIRERPNG